jgi:hypothetical protein
MYVIILICLFILTKERHRNLFRKNSEIRLPLVPRTQKALNAFLWRLVILTAVAVLVFLQALFFIPGMNEK